MSYSESFYSSHFQATVSYSGASIPGMSAESRSDNSAIDDFGLSKNRPAADEITAQLDRLALDEIDRAPEKPFQRLLKVAESRKIIAGLIVEGDKKISVTALGIKICLPRSRAEHLKPRHAISTAERSKSIAFFLNVGLHSFPDSRQVPP